MVAFRKHTRPKISQSVLPSEYRFNSGSDHSTNPHILATSDWFPSLQPSASDLNGHRCGAHQMLTLVAYDIADPKRLHQVAKVCEDWGMRIQYSVFECRLEASSFNSFWAELSVVIDPKFDRIVAYKICTKCAREIHSAGVQEHYEKVVAYIC